MPQLIVVFGGSGFVGRHVVAKLAKTGARIRVAVRHPNLAARVFPMGDPGQIAALRCDVTNEAHIAQAVQGADAVVNLVGVLSEWGAQNFKAIHADAAFAVASSAKAAGVKSFVQMSALGAAPDSPSAYARSKADGEKAAQENVPGAIVIRPSVVFGPEDAFFNRFGAMAARLPVLPLFGGGENKMQPVFAGDVAEAVARALKMNASGVFELGGPRVYTFKELMEYVCSATGRSPFLLNVPFVAGKAIAALAEWWPYPPVTRDQLTMLQTDNVVAPGARSFADLGVAPLAVEAVVPDYLFMYRKQGQFTDLRRQ